MKSKNFAALISALVICFAASGAAAKPHTVTRHMPVDSTFVEVEISWKNGVVSYKSLMKINVVAGKIEVCGVGAFIDAQYRSTTTQILRKRVLEMNGKPILKDFMFFARVSNSRKLKNAQANCVLTGAAVPRKPPSFAWGGEKGSYRID